VSAEKIQSPIRRGSRVGAILGEDEDKVELLGYGVYLGDAVPVGAAGPIAAMMVEHDCPIAQIRLDNGKMVWGCECRWGEEDLVRRHVSLVDKRVVHVDIDEERANERAFLS
jgi:hypothetical protein